MKRGLQRLLMCLFASSLLATTPASADSCFDCFSGLCDFDGCLEVGGAALYWKPCHNRFQVGTSDVTTGNTFKSRVHTLKVDYHWGFKVWAGYHSCDGCEFWNVSWTRICGSDSVHFTPPGSGTLNAFVPCGGELIADPLILENVAFIKAREKLEYNVVPVHYGRNLHCGCNSRFYAYGGARYVNFENTRQVGTRSVNENTGDAIINFKEKAELDGFGLDLGIGGEYGIWCDLNVVASFGVTAGLGEKKRRLFCRDEPFTSTATETLWENPSQWGCIYGFNLNVGLNYTYECNCWQIVGQIGWETDYYANALVLRDSPLLNPSATRTRDVAIGGPYAALMVRF